MLVAMTVGIARLVLFVPGSHSLKEKRMVLRKLQDRTREKFGVALAEVGENDVWQRAQLGLAVVGKERAATGAFLDEVLRFLEGQADVTHVEKELQTFGTSSVGAAFKHWEG